MQWAHLLHKPMLHNSHFHLTPAVADLLPCEVWLNKTSTTNPPVDCLVVIPWHQFNLLNWMWTTENPKIDLFRDGNGGCANMIFVLPVHPCGHDPLRLFFKVAQPQPPPSYPLFIQGWLANYRTKDGVPIHSGWCSNFVLSFTKSVNSFHFKTSPSIPQPLPNCYLKFSGPLLGWCPIYTNNVPPQEWIAAHHSFWSVENRRPVSEGSVPPRGSIADLWGPPWEKKQRMMHPFDKHPPPGIDNHTLKKGATWIHLDSWR